MAVFRGWSPKRRDHLILVGIVIALATLLVVWLEQAARMSL